MHPAPTDQRPRGEQRGQNASTHLWNLPVTGHLWNGPYSVYCLHTIGLDIKKEEDLSTIKESAASPCFGSLPTPSLITRTWTKARALWRVRPFRGQDKVASDKAASVPVLRADLSIIVDAGQADHRRGRGPSLHFTK